MNAISDSYLVGDYRVDPRTRTIFGPKGARILSAPTMDVIETLAANAGQPIATDHIVRDVWHGDPNARRLLMDCIASLRQLFGDSPQNPRYIQTIAGYGYRLIAPVQPLPESVAIDSVSQEGIGTTDQSSRLWKFLIELRERKVCRAALLYAIVVWLIFQIGDVVFEALHFPDWVLSFVVVTGILGFPIAMTLAWIFEVTPEGLELDIPYSDSGTRQKTKGDTCWNFALLAATLLISFQMLPSGLVASGSDGAKLERLQNADSIVVTPFQATNVSLETQAYAFALSEQLRYLLSMDLNLNVIAVHDRETLDSGYRRADLILQGSIAIAQNATRIMIHLVDPSSGHDLWSSEIVLSGDSGQNSYVYVARQILVLLPIGQLDDAQESKSLLAKLSENSLLENREKN